MFDHEIKFSTRSNEGIFTDHSSLQDALQSFLQDTGYRLDFYFSDESVLHIYRDEFFDSSVKEGKFTHPAFSNYVESVSKILYYHPEKSIDNSNVIRVNFT
jgi:hypothetical protein